MFKTRCALDSAKSPITVVIGKKDTGKTFLVMHLLHLVRDSFPVGTVISPTEAVNETFQNIIPSKLIHDKYTPQLVENIIKRQYNVKSARKNDKRTRGSSNIDSRAFLIMDDCLYAKKSWINEESTAFLFMNGRHIDLATFITMQYPLGITPNFRTNVDFVFILRENNARNRHIIYENYAGMFPTYDMFSQFMDACTEDFNCLVICTNVQSNKLDDQVFWYKATEDPPFRMCDDSLWANNKPFASAMLAQDEYNPELVRKKASGPWVHVNKLN